MNDTWSGLAGSHEIDKETTLVLLRCTAANNPTGLIGGPWAPDGYTPPGALAIAGRCTRFARGTHLRQEAISALLPGYGVHTWYLNLATPKENPWA